MTAFFGTLICSQIKLSLNGTVYRGFNQQHSSWPNKYSNNNKALFSWTAMALKYFCSACRKSTGEDINLDLNTEKVVNGTLHVWNWRTGLVFMQTGIVQPMEVHVLQSWETQWWQSEPVSQVYNKSSGTMYHCLRLLYIMLAKALDRRWGETACQHLTSLSQSQ